MVQIDWDHERSFKNWAQPIGLICRPGWQIGLLGSAFFAGWTSTLLWVPQLSNIFGRLAVFRYSCLASLLLYTALMMSRSYYLTLASMFFMGCSTPGKLGVGWPYFVELIGKRNRTFYGTLLNVFVACHGICTIMFCLFISRNTYYIMAVGWFIQFTAFLLTRYLPESPVYFFHKGMLKQAENSLRHIAKINGKQFEFNYADFDSNSLKVEGRQSLISYHSGESNPLTLNQPDSNLTT